MIWPQFSCATSGLFQHLVWENIFLWYCSVKKIKGFFDDSDEDKEHDFETFEGDSDYNKMRAEKAKTDVSDEVDEEDLGTSWGGKAYSFQKGVNNF